MYMGSMTTHTYSPVALREARGWISDCWDTDTVDPDELSDDEVVNVVRRHYDGGFVAFLRDIASLMVSS